MPTLLIEILNPHAINLLKELDALDLISIKESEDDGFLKLVKKLRTKAKNSPPSLVEITKKIEAVRAKRKRLQ